MGHDGKPGYDMIGMLTTSVFHPNFQTKNIMPATMNTAEMARNFFAEKINFTISPAELNQQLQNGANITVIDVRATEDFIKGHVPRAINLPEGQWSKTTGWPKERQLVIYCYSQICHLAAHAALAFANQGYSVMEMDGGFAAWKENKLPVEI
jgi:rhodanese-related sulfurtransferase